MKKVEISGQAASATIMDHGIKFGILAIDEFEKFQIGSNRIEGHQEKGATEFFDQFTEEKCYLCSAS